MPSGIRGTLQDVGCHARCRMGYGIIGSQNLGTWGTLQDAKCIWDAECCMRYGVPCGRWGFVRWEMGMQDDPAGCNGIWGTLKEWDVEGYGGPGRMWGAMWGTLRRVGCSVGYEVPCRMCSMELRDTGCPGGCRLTRGRHGAARQSTARSSAGRGPLKLGEEREAVAGPGRAAGSLGPDGAAPSAGPSRAVLGRVSASSGTGARLRVAVPGEVGAVPVSWVFPPPPHRSVAERTPAFRCGVGEGGGPRFQPLRVRCGGAGRCGGGADTTRLCARAAL